MTLQQEKIRAARLSIASNSLLILFKLIVGLSIGAVSILSEAIHSAVDLVAAVIALFSVRTSSVPADTRHPFGHGKVENISGVVEALLIFLAAGWIIYEAVERILHPRPLGYIAWGIAVMLISAAANYFVSAWLFRIGRAADSIALKADAWHLRTDVYTSAGVMAGLAAIWLGQRFAPDLDLHWLDPAVAIAVALLIIRAAWHLTLQSARDLLDVQLPPEEEAWIRQLIIDHRPIIHGFHRLRTRKAGNFRFVEFHMKVDPDMSVQESHRITEELARAIEGHFPSASVTIHTEPCDGDCVGNCLTGCLLTEEKRRNIMAGKKIAS
ncbi:MAG TPA: cation transporter [Syntrophus sp. (in: bacteria)]|jgi:cation diffusion facilitator family transporter|nr:cation transporter [Syntrophus sp. (in: bacteria)]